MAKLAAKTYGEALFETALEGKCMDALAEETEGVRRVLEENPELDRLLRHPRISRPEKAQILRKVFGGCISQELLGFLELVLEKGRWGELPAIWDYFAERVREEQGVGVAFVTTAAELSPAKKDAVERRLLDTTSYRRMEMHFQVDSSLIGGMVIRVKDRVVDSSIRTKLANMKSELLQIQLG